MDDPKKLTVQQAKRAAKRLVRAGGIKHAAALNQIAREQGFDNFEAMRLYEIGNPPPPPAYDFIVRIGAGRGAPEEIGIWKNQMLEFHGIDQAEFDEARTSEKEMFVTDFALWSKRRKGDFAEYDVEVVKGIADDRPDFGLHWDSPDADRDPEDTDDPSPPGR